MNRVTDTCIPEMEAMRRIEGIVLEEWVAADKAGRSHFPHEFLYKVLRGGKLRKLYQIDPKNSWLLAACEKNLPIFVPGWEDSTLGNMFAAHVISGVIKNVHTVRTGIEYMVELARWYTKTAKKLRDRRGLDRLLPDRRRHRGRFPDLRGADAAPGPAAQGHTALGLFLPGQRLDDQLRQLFRGGAEREDHLGQARRVDAEVHHRVRRHHRRAR